MRIQRFYSLSQCGTALLVAAVLAGWIARMTAAEPGWWQERGVIKMDGPTRVAANDYAAINQGQLKQLATAAFDEWQDNLPGGAGSEVTTMVRGWFETDPETGELITPRTPKATEQTNDFSPVNLGMLKTVAKPFYDRLITMGYASGYPWEAPGRGAPNDYAVANIGQAKNLFNFEVTVDADEDDVPDWWTTAYAHNSFAQARTIADGGMAQGMNLYATKESGEPNHAGNAGGKSLWFRWQASANETMTFETAGSNFDTTLAVYTGANLSSLSLVASDDDGGPGFTSRVSFAAQSGVTYWIAIDGFSGVAGNFILRWATPDDDTDDDGMPGSYELAYGLNLTINDAARDKDLDGLTNLQEFLLGTMPNQPDTDDDGLSDGWETLYSVYGFSALVNNETDADPDNDPEADPDGDGLDNAYEDQIGTNPYLADTDGDGATDFDEDRAGSDALGAGSTPANPGGPGGTGLLAPIVPVEVTFGDHSDSHSEKYRVYLEPLEGDPNKKKRYRTNRKYGETQTDTFRLPAGAKYRITLVHVGTDPNYEGPPHPDYDYTLEFALDSNDSAIAVITQDPQDILGVHDESEEFFAKGKNATLNVAWLKSVTVATVPANRGRKKLGVGEKVGLVLWPTGLPSPEWVLEETPATSTLSPLPEAPEEPAYRLMTAGTRACTPTVQVTTLGATLSIDFNVVEPSGEQVVEGSDRALTLAEMENITAQQQGAGMYLEIETLPTDVSFENVEVIEVDKGTLNITNYFLVYPPPAHIPEDWLQLGPGNKWGDSAAFMKNPKIWGEGTYDYLIEVRWRVVGDSDTDGEWLAVRTQKHKLHDATGKSTVEKMGKSKTRTPTP